MPARPTANVSSRAWHGAAEAICCLGAMTAGLRWDVARAGYLNLDFCSTDSAISQMLAIHLALLPASCLAMYATTILAVWRWRTSDGDARHIAREALLATVQIVAGAVIMDAPPFSSIGDGFVRAWLAMAAAMAVAHAGRCGVRRIDTRTKGNEHARC